jgi:hypothetical protein
MYSQKDIVDYLRKFFSPVTSGDSLASVPWGNEDNKKLFVAISTITDDHYGIDASVRRTKQ